MKVLTKINQYRPVKTKPLFLGLGNFDGLHLGHQALIHRVVDRARRTGGIPALLTFRTHPQHVLHPDKKWPLLFSGDYKLFLFQQAGIELCFWLNFTKKFAKTDAENFVRKWLDGKLRVREICMGYNARFGRDRKGDGALMKILSHELGFDFSDTPPVKVAGEIVSSSRIRQLVETGNLSAAKACLGRPFSLLGEVVYGAGRGKKLGFPTANLNLTSTALPPRGVYPVWVRRIEWTGVSRSSGKIGIMQPNTDKWVKGILNLGFRPTFERRTKVLHAEVFILNYTGSDFYGKKLEVVFSDRLREERTFPDAKALKRQIQTDIRMALRKLEKDKEFLYKTGSF